LEIDDRGQNKANSHLHKIRTNNNSKGLNFGNNKRKA
jgi:hypothetical protein